MSNLLTFGQAVDLVTQDGIDIAMVNAGWNKTSFVTRTVGQTVLAAKFWSESNRRAAIENGGSLEVHPYLMLTSDGQTIPFGVTNGHLFGKWTRTTNTSYVVGIEKEELNIENNEGTIGQVAVGLTFKSKLLSYEEFKTTPIVLMDAYLAGVIGSNIGTALLSSSLSKTSDAFLILDTLLEVNGSYSEGDTFVQENKATHLALLDHDPSKESTADLIRDINLGKQDKFPNALSFVIDGDSYAESDIVTIKETLKALDVPHVVMYAKALLGLPKAKVIKTPSVELAHVVAMTEDGLIGVNNDLPWKHCPADLKFFKQKTLGKNVLMGFKTLESLPFKLKDRNIYQLNTRIKSLENATTHANADFTVTSIDMFLKTPTAQPERIIAGGGTVYAETIDQVDVVYANFIRRIDGTPITQAPVDSLVYYPISKLSENFIRESEEEVESGDYIVTMTKWVRDVE